MRMLMLPDVFRPNQVHKKAIEVDAHLRVKGAPVGEVYAIGDASTVCDLAPHEQHWLTAVLCPVRRLRRRS